MKNIIIPILLGVVLLLVVINLDAITDYTASLVSARPTVTIDDANKYSNNFDFLYVQKSKNFVPYSKQDLLDIFYSIFDNGYETFTFYCPSEYTECLSDIGELTKSQSLMTDIGNYVHPFNNFSNLKVVTDSLGQIDVIVTHTYTDLMRKTIDAKMDEIFKNILTDDMDIHDKILKIHDYIIDNTYYDMDNSSNSGNAYGTLIEGKSKCAGYADAMAIALSRLGVKNYKVASEKHVWNAAYIDDEWTQIDLTWDDPVVEGEDVISDNIRHKFYMIDTDTILSYDTDEHNFDMNIYIELR